MQKSGSVSTFTIKNSKNKKPENLSEKKAKKKRKQKMQTNLTGSVTALRKKYKNKWKSAKTRRKQEIKKYSFTALQQKK